MPLSSIKAAYKYVFFHNIKHADSRPYQLVGYIHLPLPQSLIRVGVFFFFMKNIYLQNYNGTF